MSPAQSVGPPFCLVVAHESGLRHASKVSEELGRTQGVLTRIATFVSATFRSREPPCVVVLLLDGAPLEHAASVVRQCRVSAAECALFLASRELTRDELCAAGFPDGCEVIASGSPDAIAERVRSALTRTEQGPDLGPAGTSVPRINGLIGTSRCFLKQVAKLATIAGCDAGALILGETGTGKEVCAQAIHYLSARASRPWVAVNCGAIPNELVEDEFFGHVKGAYTTAHAARHGLVREAEGGTLFLDEIDTLSRAAQVKLLRFLQEKEYRSVGSNTVVRADVRVIAASNQRLAELTQQGVFRQDLFFRLNVLTLHMPSLRERAEDVPLLAREFIRESAHKWGRGPMTFAPETMRRLLHYEWPGNVRELKNVIERAVLLSRCSVLQPEDLELDAETESAAEEPFQRAKARAVARFERGYIEQLLMLHGGNITHAAHAAGKNRRAFWQLIRKHRIEAQRFRAL